VVRPSPDPVTLPNTITLVHEENVQLPRLFRAWHAARRATREEALADVLTDIMSAGRTSRMYRRLILEDQIAQTAVAASDGGELSGTVLIDIMARPDVELARVNRAFNDILDDICRTGVSDLEIRTSINKKEVQLVRRLSTNLGVAGALATYHTLDGNAHRINTEFNRFDGVSREEVRSLASTLRSSASVALSIVPTGERQLAIEELEAAQ
jgi:zinc protease